MGLFAFELQLYMWKQLPLNNRGLDSCNQMEKAFAGYKFLL